MPKRGRAPGKRVQRKRKRPYSESEGEGQAPDNTDSDAEPEFKEGRKITASVLEAVPPARQQRRRGAAAGMQTGMRMEAEKKLACGEREAAASMAVVQLQAVAVGEGEYKEHDPGTDDDEEGDDMLLRRSSRARGGRVAQDAERQHAGAGSCSMV